jgi:hypothetical protein
MDGSDELPPADPPESVPDPHRPRHSKAARLVSGLFAPRARQAAGPANEGAAGQAEGAAGMAAVRSGVY